MFYFVNIVCQNTKVILNENASPETPKIKIDTFHLFFSLISW